MSQTNYEREIQAVEPPNLTGVNLTVSEHMSAVKAGEIAASHTRYAGEELVGYAAVQNSSLFGASLMLAALKRVGEITREVDSVEVAGAMIEIMEEAGIPFSVGQGGDSAA